MSAKEEQWRKVIDAEEFERVREELPKKYKKRAHKFIDRHIE